MKDLDADIDKLMREKLITLIQENSVRTNKATVKFTKNNKKYTLEHWVTHFDSYDKLFRALPKELVKVEKDIRAKFASTLTEERLRKLKVYINTEANVLFEKLDKVVGTEFRRYKAENEFMERLEKSREKYKEAFEANIEKCVQALNQDVNLEGRVQAPEVCKIYDINETFLHAINLLGPLQSINICLNKAESGSSVHKSIVGVQGAIKELARTFKEESSGTYDTVGARKMRKMQVARETLLFRDIVVDVEPMIVQSVLPPEQRNLEVVSNLWDRIEEYFQKGRPDWKDRKVEFQNLFELLKAEGTS